MINMKASRVLALVVATAVGCGAFVGVIFISMLNAKYDLKLDSLVGALGTIVGAIGLGFGAYFALLAVDAYGHFKNLQAVGTKAEEALSTLERRQHVVDDIEAKMGEVYSNTFGLADHVFVSLYQVVVSALPPSASPMSKKRSKELANNISINRARFALMNPTLPDEEIVRNLMTLASEGEEKDLDLIAEFSRNPSRSQTVHISAAGFLKSAKERLRHQVAT